jgi:hypothetical protein
MAEETESQAKEETHDFEDEEQGKISNEVFESGIKEPQKVEDQQLNVLPENEEKKEEIPLTTASLASALKAKSSPRKRQPNEISSADIR